jgi:gliding motility-associated-like protein
MRICALVIVQWVTYIQLYSQHEADHWYFSDGATLQFQKGNIVVLNNSKITYSEPAASISDCIGNLLFYTDGNKVWNKNHDLMINGTGLIGHYSATQGALIIPWPGSCGLFYVFTLDAIEHGFANGLNYSVVDIKSQNDVGEVVSKNNALYPFASEKMTAVYHSDRNSVWLITHEMYSNKFFTYRIKESGLDIIPVISIVGDTLTRLMALGQMKASPDGSRVAYATLVPSEIHLFDFDHVTGVLSNPKIIDATAFKGSSLYGLEFSPDSKQLYVTKHDVDYLNLPGYLYQLDLSFTNANEILNSAIIVGNNKPPSDMRGLQLTNDGRIMVCKNLSNFYGIIHEPNKRGTASRYEDQALTTGKFLSHWTFPNLISSYFSPTFNSSIKAGFKLSNALCTGEAISIQNHSVNASQYYWDFGNGDVSFEQIPIYQYEDTGTYQIKLIAENGYCCSDTFVQQVYVNNCDERIFIPNSFSPNGDNINDYFEIFGNTITQFSIHIYDRWGNLVFSDSKENPDSGMNQLWNGKVDDEACLPGVYIYTIEVGFQTGNKKTVSGNISLLR